MSDRAVRTLTGSVACLFCFPFASTPPFFSSLLAAWSPKVEQSSLGPENSESLFLKTSDSDPAPRQDLPPPLLASFSLPHSFSVFTFCLFVSLCLYLSFPFSFCPSPRSLSCQRRKVAKKEASQSHQCDLI